ncbi:hypothetical protein AB0C98_00945 [Streptomyces sp. NPDC048558]|uniref:hypothetical protein n=1 Tax=Streptomyces sp. NPDC048558 TaxID=3155759 RepID=UPI003405C50F
MPAWVKWLVGVVALGLIVATPLVWLNDPGAGEFVGASLQAGTGVAALAWALITGLTGDDPGAQVTGSGTARATGGAKTRTGIQLRGRGRGRGPLRVENSGDAVAHGSGSEADTGITEGNS